MTKHQVDGMHPESGDLGRLIDELAQCHGSLASAGLPVAAAYVGDASQSLRLAASAEAAVFAREHSPPFAIGTAVPLTLADGRETGIWLTPSSTDRLADRGRLDADGTFIADNAVADGLPTLPMADPCWDLVASSDAAAFATDDLAAALLARALVDFAWMSRRHRVRALISRGSAEMALRVLRGGRPVPALRGSTPPLLDRAVHDLLDGLGWRPEQDLDLPQQHR